MAGKGYKWGIKDVLALLVFYGLLGFFFYRYILWYPQGQIRLDLPIFVLVLIWMASESARDIPREPEPPTPKYVQPAVFSLKKILIYFLGLAATVGLNMRYLSDPDIGFFVQGLDVVIFWRFYSWLNESLWPVLDQKKIRRFLGDRGFETKRVQAVKPSFWILRTRSYLVAFAPWQKTEGTEEERLGLCQIPFGAQVRPVSGFPSLEQNEGK